MFSRKGGAGDSGQPEAQGDIGNKQPHCGNTQRVKFC